MPAIRRLHVVAHTHHDVGYTNSPRIVDRMHARIVDEVLDLVADHRDAPDPERFRWTFEVLRPVLQYLRRTGGPGAARLREAVEAGLVAVTAGQLNMTQLPGESEFEAGYDALATLREARIPVRTEQHGDVNGIAWGAVDAMTRAGVSRLIMALNPDHGRPPFEQPTAFRWQGPTGRSVFTLLSTHYGFGEEWGLVDGDASRALAHIERFVDRLNERDDWPFDSAIVHAGNDNRWPTDRVLAVVRAWNAAHPEVRMTTATIDHALDALESVQVELPVVRGEWADWWAHGHGSAARDVAAYRAARTFQEAATAQLGLAALAHRGEPRLAEVLGYRRGPVRARSDDEVLADLAEVDEQLLLYGEHTFGSWETYSKPFSRFTASHDNAKAGFAYAAHDLARDLAIEGMFRFATTAGDDVAPGSAASGANATGTDASNTDVTGTAAPSTYAPGTAVPDTLAPTEGRALVVNPSELPRTEPIELEVAGRRRVTLVVDVPAFSARTVPVTADEPPASAPGRELVTDRYAIAVDPARGATSIRDLATERELVDAAAGHGLGAVLLEQVRPGETHPMVTRDPKAFNPAHPGPDFDRVLAAGDAEPRITRTSAWSRIAWTSTAPLPDAGRSGAGLLRAEHRITCFADSDLIDVSVVIDKPESFAPESVFVAFPFALAQPRFLVETAGAVFEAETEQLPDTSRDWYSVQHAVGVDGLVGGDAGSTARAGVLWGAVDAPLVQLGGIHTGRWAQHLDAPVGHVNSWVMNTLHFTNFPARQGGRTVFGYRIRPLATPPTRAQVRRFGRDLLLPLQARWQAGAEPDAVPAPITVEPADQLLAAVRPVPGGGVRVRLRNLAEHGVTARVTHDGEVHEVEVGALDSCEVVIQSS